MVGNIPTLGRRQEILSRAGEGMTDPYHTFRRNDDLLATRTTIAWSYHTVNEGVDSAHYRVFIDSGCLGNLEAFNERGGESGRIVHTFGFGEIKRVNENVESDWTLREMVV